MNQSKNSLQQAFETEEDGSQRTVSEVMGGLALISNDETSEVIHPGVDPFNLIAALAHIIELGSRAALPAFYRIAYARG